LFPDGLIWRSLYAKIREKADFVEEGKMSFMENFLSKRILSKSVVGALAVGAIVALTTDVASAATITFTGGTGGDTGTVLTGGGSVKQNILANGDANIDFDWNSVVMLAYSEFTIDSSFKLTFQDYAPESDLAGGENARSGFQIYAGSYGGTLTPLLPLEPVGATPCGSDVNSNFGSTDCVLVTGAGNDGSTFVMPPATYDITSGAGTYVLMFSEGNQPDNGSAEFIISAVPLPAGGLLLLTALGGVAALRRKRDKAA
jgi:hypothetical protein